MIWFVAFLFIVPKVAYPSKPNFWKTLYTSTESIDFERPRHQIEAVLDVLWLIAQNDYSISEMDCLGSSWITFPLDLGRCILTMLTLHWLNWEHLSSLRASCEPSRTSWYLGTSSGIMKERVNKQWYWKDILILFVSNPFIWWWLVIKIRETWTPSKKLSELMPTSTHQWTLIEKNTHRKEEFLILSTHSFPENFYVIGTYI